MPAVEQHPRLERVLIFRAQSLADCAADFGVGGYAKCAIDNLAARRFLKLQIKRDGKSAHADDDQAEEEDRICHRSTSAMRIISM